MQGLSQFQYFNYLPNLCYQFYNPFQIAQHFTSSGQMTTSQELPILSLESQPFVIQNQQENKQKSSLPPQNVQVCQVSTSKVQGISNKLKNQKHIAKNRKYSNILQSSQQNQSSKSQWEVIKANIKQLKMRQRVIKQKMQDRKHISHRKKTKQSQTKKKEQSQEMTVNHKEMQIDRNQQAQQRFNYKTFENSLKSGMAPLIKIFLTNLFINNFFGQTIRQIFVKLKIQQSKLPEFYYWLHSFKINPKFHVQPSDLGVIFESQSKASFKQVFRICFYHFLRQVSVNSIETFKYTSNKGHRLLARRLLVMKLQQLQM